MTSDAHNAPDRSGEAAGLADRWAALGRRLAQVLPSACARQMKAMSGTEYSVIDYPGIARAFGLLAWETATRPDRLIAAQADLVRRNLAVARRFLADEQEDACRPDRRFKDRAWSDEPGYRLLRDSYLSTADWLEGLVRDAQSLDRQAKRKAGFYTRQIVSALSPANFAVTNPQVQRMVERHGSEVVLEGLERLVGDLERGGGRLAISQTDESAFRVGENLATTPGRVVYRNDLIELIQYEPSTDKVFRTPFLFVPPWINKYYLLDLCPENSFIRWLVSQGHTLFVISWVNPREEHAGKGFEDYMREGPLEAMRVVREITGSDDINLGGFCIGGILSVCTLAYLARTGEVPIRSATLIATMVDLAEIGDCAVFIDEPQIASIEKHAAETGYLDGHHMMDMFSMLRENDLIWNYVVNNYLLGRDPAAFDLLYWNADCTRLPARMLTDYLRDIVLKNGLGRPGTLRLGGVAIDIRDISTPCYFLSTIDDHIAPWTASYPATQMLSGPCEFVLAGSGHVAGVVNPPTREKYSYRTRRDHPRDARDWIASAGEHKGSWWPHWAAWLQKHGGSRIAARAVGSDAYPALADAPGSYVLER